MPVLVPVPVLVAVAVAVTAFVPLLLALPLALLTAPGACRVSTRWIVEVMMVMVKVMSMDDLKKGGRRGRRKERGREEGNGKTIPITSGDSHGNGTDRREDNAVIIVHNVDVGNVTLTVAMSMSLCP